MVSNVSALSNEYADDRLRYLPATFEGMMESFGLNLQRKNLYSKYNKSIDNLEQGIKPKEVTRTSRDIVNLNERAEDVTQQMQEIM